MIAEETDEEYDIGVAATTDDTHLVILSHGAVGGWYYWDQEI